MVGYSGILVGGWAGDQLFGCSLVEVVVDLKIDLMVVDWIVLREIDWVVVEVDSR